jgi:hypothetical protein
MADFAVLQWPEPGGAYFGIPVGPNLVELTSYAWGEAQPAEPVRIERNVGRRKPGDVVWIDVGKLVVSPRVVAALTGFSGWSPYPVAVHDGRGEFVPGYVGLGITGRSDPTRSDLTRVEGEGRWAEYVGLWFPLDTWDGADIFCPAIGPGPVVTARLGAALRKANLGNLLVVPLPEYRTNKASIDWLIARGKGAYAADVDLTSG